MYPITPATITTPDGVKRPLRFTFGARRRITEEFKCNLIQAFMRLDDAALPAALYCLMFDENGQPPEGLSLPVFQETADPQQSIEMMEALRLAMEQGHAPKNVLTLIDKSLEFMKLQAQTESGS